MRKGLFALMLVLASFAGGAAVNGPGLQWAKDQLLTPVVGTTIGTLGDADPDAEVLELPAAPRPPLEFPSTTRAVAPDSEEAEESMPASVAGSPPEKDNDPADDDPASEAPPSVAAPRAPSVATGRDLEPTDDETQADDSSAQEPGNDPIAPPRLLQPIDIPNSLPGAGAGSLDTSPKAPEVDWPDAPDSAPAVAMLPAHDDGRSPDRVDPAISLALDSGSERADAGPDGEGSGTGASDWDRIRRRMEELGVGRYWIEGQPGGPVQFRCVVPTVGGRVVSQHFEAEADDAVQAAEVALGRVALWRRVGVTSVGRSSVQFGLGCQ